MTILTALGILGGLSIITFIFVFWLCKQTNKSNLESAIGGGSGVICVTAVYGVLWFWYLVFAALFKYLGS